MVKRPAGFDFLAGDSEMAARMRAFDWESSPLGSPAGWPAALRTMVRMALLTRHPVFIFWGAQHICLYNDAYSASIGPEKHPGILGQPGQPAWAEIWHVIGPQIDQVLRGDGATWHENQLVPIIRHGAIQEVYWTYSFAPIHDETAENGIGGVLVLCTETTEQVLTKQRLSSEHQRLSALFEQAPTFMVLLSGPVHVVELANPAYMELIGQRDVIGRPITECVPEAEAQGFLRLLDDVYQSGKPFVGTSVSYLRPGASSEPRYLDFVYQPISNELGETVGIFVAGTDVTERDRALVNLKSSEEQLRLATEAAEVGLWDVDLVRETLYWPQRVKAMFGIHSRREVSMKDFYTGLHPDDRERVSAEFAAAADPARKAVYDVEYRTVGLEDGVVRWVAAKGRGIFEGERCVRVVGTALDITRRKRDEERIRQLHETLERRLTEYLAERKIYAELVEGTDAFVQVADRDFNWLAINRASADEFERIFGSRPAVGKNMLQLLATVPEHQEAVRRVWSRALSGEEFTEVESFGDPGRDRRSYEMHFRPLMDPEGQVTGAYQFVYDVTERVENERRLAQAEAALHQAQKMEAVGQLTGGLAHDFNNLLQAVHSNFELLRRKPTNAGLVTRLAERGLATTARASRLTSQLLTFSRLQSLDIRPLNLRELLDGMEELLNATLGNQVDLGVEQVNAALWVEADPSQLEMAVLNLAINARDAMPAGGRLRVYVCNVTSENVDLCVQDSGLGMSAETVRRAFEPFFTTKEVGKGSGLGLSQVYAMAVRAKGSVRIDSTPGQGTTIILTLRRVSKSAREGSALGASRHADDHVKGRILVIDDDSDVRQGLIELLRQLGHEVLEAASGELGLAVLEAESVDAILLDFAMPGMTGAQVAPLAKAMRPNAALVFMSGYSDMDAIAAAVGQEATLLRKPFDIEAVHQILQKSMRQRRDIA